MSLAPFVRIVARGQGRARPLTFDEAQEAMTLILRGAGEPEAIGALLMVLRLRGEVAEEIAGFTAALQQVSQREIPKADLDWPSYAAGRTRGAPLFLLAARLVGQAGYSIAMHGWNSHQAQGASLRAALHLAGPKVQYYPLEEVCPPAFNLLRLRDTFGLRSCINTVLRMWNPSGAGASVQGVFHPSYGGLQTRAAGMLPPCNVTIIKGGGGEFERHPGKTITLFGRRDGYEQAVPAPALMTLKRRLNDGGPIPPLAAIWDGAISDPFLTATITGTAALALWTLKATPTLAEAEEMAITLWQTRPHTQRLMA